MWLMSSKQMAQRIESSSHPAGSLLVDTTSIFQCAAMNKESPCLAGARKKNELQASKRASEQVSKAKAKQEDQSKAPSKPFCLVVCVCLCVCVKKQRPHFPTQNQREKCGLSAHNGCRSKIADLASLNTLGCREKHTKSSAIFHTAR